MKKLTLISALTLSILTLAYIGGWYYIEHKMDTAITQLFNSIGPNAKVRFLGGRPKVQGYPGIPTITYKHGILINEDVAITFPKLTIKGFPLPFSTLKIEAKHGITLSKSTSKTVLSLNKAHLTIKVPPSFPISTSPYHITTWQKSVGKIDIKELSITADKYKITAKGMIGLDSNLQPICNISTNMQNYEVGIKFLTSKKKISPLTGALLLSALNAKSTIIEPEKNIINPTNEDVVELDITFKDGKIIDANSEEGIAIRKEKEKEKENQKEIKQADLDIKIKNNKLYIDGYKVKDIPKVNWKKPVIVKYKNDLNKGKQNEQDSEKVEITDSEIMGTPNKAKQAQPAN